MAPQSVPADPPRATCFVIMPFGRKPDAAGRIVDFDAVYDKIIAPAVEAVGFEPLRADEETSGGVIHNAMFERLVLSQYAIADLSIFNPNVYYELGVRHAVRPQSTVLISAGDRLPFDVVHLRTIPYALDARGRPKEAARSMAALVARLEHCKNSDEPDSPLFRYAQGWLRAPEVDHSKTDLFRGAVSYSRAFMKKLDAARALGKKDSIAALDEVRKELGDLRTREAGVVIDLFLSYRAAEGHDEMIDLYEAMDPVIQNTTLAREQYAFALNRAGRSQDAEDVLKALIDERGESSETNGILGRVYKDRWDKARAANDPTAAGFAEQAIAAYLRGFEADWRDFYPGVNVLNLIHVLDPADPRLGRLTPVVRYAVERAIARNAGDYWAHATLVELHVLEGDDKSAEKELPRALAKLREPWEAKTTVGTLARLRDVRRAQGLDVQRLDGLIAALQARAKSE